MHVGGEAQAVCHNDLADDAANATIAIVNLFLLLAGLLVSKTKGQERRTFTLQTTKRSHCPGDRAWPSWTPNMAKGDSTILVPI